MKKPLALAATGAVLALTLGACGSSSNGGTTRAGSTGRQGGFTGPGMGQGAGRGFPGTSGKVAAVSGKTAQVQADGAQTAVTWTSATTFTAEKKVPASAVKVGSCVMAQPSRTAHDNSGSSAAEVAAATVRIVSGSGGCTAGFRGHGRGNPPSGMPTNMPTDRPSGMPSTGGRSRFGGFGAFGKVTAVSGSGFTVQSAIGGSSREVTVTTSSSTTYTENASATSAAVRVGVCLTAQGSTSSTGAVTAKRVSVSDAVKGQCTGGFGLGGVFRGAPGSAGQATAQGS